MAIRDYIDKHNDNPKAFVWTAKASDVLEKVKRARAVLDKPSWIIVDLLAVLH